MEAVDAYLSGKNEARLMTLGLVHAMQLAAPEPRPVTSFAGAQATLARSADIDVDGLSSAEERRAFLLSTGLGAFETGEAPLEKAPYVMSDARAEILKLRLSRLSGRTMSLLDARVPQTQEVIKDHMRLSYSKRWVTPLLVQYHQSEADQKERVDAPRAKACVFRQDADLAGADARTLDYQLANKLIAAGADKWARGHERPFDAYTDKRDAAETCSLANIAVQSSHFNSTSYLGLEKVVRAMGDADIAVGDLFLDARGRKLARPNAWTLGGPGTFAVVRTKSGDIVHDPKTQKPLVIAEAQLPSRLATLKKNHPELAWDSFEITIAKSLPIPTHRFIAMHQRSRDGRPATMAAWIAPNSGDGPGKKAEYDKLIHSGRAEGGWQSTVDEVEALSGIDLFRVLPNAEERALEAQSTFDVPAPGGSASLM